MSIESADQTPSPEAKLIADLVNNLKNDLKASLPKGGGLTLVEIGYLMALKDTTKVSQHTNLEGVIACSDPIAKRLLVNPNPGGSSTNISIYSKSYQDILNESALTDSEKTARSVAFKNWAMQVKIKQDNFKTAPIAGAKKEPKPKSNLNSSRRKFLKYGLYGLGGLVGAGAIGVIGNHVVSQSNKMNYATQNELEKTLFTQQEAGLAEPISPTRALIGLAGGKYTIQFNSTANKYKFVESGSSKNEKPGDVELKEAIIKIIERAGKLGLKLNDIEMLVALDLWSQAPEAVLNNDNFGFLEIYKNLTNEFDATKTPANLLLLASVYAYINPNTQTMQIGNSNLIQLLLSQMRRHIELYRGTEMFQDFSNTPLEIPGNVSATLGEAGKIDTFYEATTIADSDFVTQLGDAALAGGAGHTDFARVMPLHTKPLKFEINNQFQILSPLPGTVVKIELGKYTNAKDSSKNGKIIPDNIVLPSGEDEVYNLRTDDWPNGHLGHRLVIQIDHDIPGYEEYGGLYMHIFHLPSDITSLKVGQKIKAGDILSIGKSYSGSGTGNHASAGFNNTTVSVGDAGANNGNNGLANGQEFTRDVVQPINLVDKNGQTAMLHPLTGKIIDRNNQTKDIGTVLGLKNNNYIVDQRDKLGIKRPRYIRRFDGNTKVYQE
jgi:hypothetical protein